MSESTNIGGFTFEEWAQLFIDNPEQFEVCREQALETFIKGVKPCSRERLRALIKTFDELASGKSPGERLQIATIMTEERLSGLASATSLFANTVTQALLKKK